MGPAGLGVDGGAGVAGRGAAGRGGARCGPAGLGGGGAGEDEEAEDEDSAADQEASHSVGEWGDTALWPGGRVRPGFPSARLSVVRLLSIVH